MELKHLDHAAFQQYILQGKGVAVVDFFAEWCGPCKILGPIMQELSAEYGDQVWFYKVDVDVEQELAIKYMVQSIPTVIIFKDGQMVGEPHIGLSPKEYYQSQIQNLL